jgi:transposase
MPTAKSDRLDPAGVIERGMPAAASRDLRERAVRSYLRGDGTYQEVAEQFDIGPASLRRWVRRMRECGHVEPDGHSGGRESKVPDDALAQLRAFVGQDPDRTVAEITAQWCRRMKVRMSRSAMLRALHRAGLTLKKSQFARRSSSAKPSSRVEQNTSATSRRSTSSNSSSSTSRAATSR